MNAWSRMHALLKNLTQRKKVESDLDAELRAYAEMLADERIAAGIPPVEARRRALAELEGLEQVKQTVRDVRAGTNVERLWQDVQFGLRQLRRSPGFTLTALMMLALGIGVTTAMYSVVYAVILKPLPFAQPDRLVEVGAKPFLAESLPTLLDWQKNTRSFESIAAYTGWTPRIESSAETGHANALLVSQNFLNTLGVPLRLGHAFTHSGQESDCFHQAIVTDGYWRRIGGGSTLDGRSLQLDYKTYSIIGVIAPNSELEDMEALGEPSILTPIGCDPSKAPTSRGDIAFRAMARLKPGVSISVAQAELTRAQKDLSQVYPRYYPSASIPVITPLTGFVNGANTRSAMLATLAA